jgi:hypothetical protein
LDNFSALGRFTQPDSIVPKPRISLSYDRYAYSANNPLQYNDPTGHNPAVLALGFLFTIGAPEIIIGVLVVAIVVVAWDTFAPGKEQRHEEITNWFNETVGNINAAFASGNAGGASQAAQHLAMLLGGQTVAGFAPHPGMPDPDGRDRKHNVEGLRNTLKDIQHNMRQGENINDFLTRQGWSNQQIQQFNSAVNNYVNNVLPTDVDYYGVSQDLADEVINLAGKIGIK